MDEASGNCTEVTRSTDVVLVAGNEASELFVVREDRTWTRVDEVNLTMGRPTSGFRLASALSSEDSALIDPPLAYHVDCGPNTSFVAQTGALSSNGLEVFHLALGGKFAGEPEEGLLRSCHDTGLLLRNLNEVTIMVM